MENVALTSCGHQHILPRDLVCTKSTVLAKALEPGHFKEGSTGVIDLVDVDPEHLQRLVSFFQTDGHPDTVTITKEHFNQLEERLLQDDGHAIDPRIRWRNEDKFDRRICGVDDFEAWQTHVKDVRNALIELQRSTDAIEGTSMTAVEASRNALDCACEGTCALDMEGMRVHLTAMINIAMYIIADRYDIEELKGEACFKLGLALKDHWPLFDLPALVEMAYNSTPSSDKGVRPVLEEHCARHYKWFPEDPFYNDAVEAFPTFIIGVLESRIEILNDEVAELWI